jgi:hypothetical protein
MRAVQAKVAKALALKIGGIVAGALIIGGAAMAIAWDRTPQHVSIPAVQTSVPAPAISVTVDTAAIDPATLPIAKPAETKPAATRSSTVADDPDTLRAEAEHLAQLRLLAKTDPAAAAKLADEGNARFPKGTLKPEREAIAVLSLAKSGQTDEAKTRGEVFLKTWPKGPLAEQVRKAIGQ